MIPEKLYIPTSTLNFNSIIANESISPVSFYSKRGFGYKRFEKVVPNRLDNIIILYEKYVLFDTDSKELDNYPLVIEVDVPSVPYHDSITEENGAFSFNKTVYLNPFNTRFIFRNEEELHITLSNAQRSIEAKLIPIYRNQMMVLTNCIETQPWHELSINDIERDVHQMIESDLRIDKLKGLLYGYLIGTNTATSNSIVSLKRLSKELYNIWASILSSPNCNPTPRQKNQIDSIYSQMSFLFDELEELSLLIEKARETAERYKLPAEPLFHFLKDQHLYDCFIENIKETKNLRSSINFNSFSPKTKDNQMGELDQYVQLFNIQIFQLEMKYKKPNILTISMPVVNNSIIHETPIHTAFLPKLLNTFLEENYSEETFLNKRNEFALKGGKLFRDELKEKWNGSPTQLYINSLLDNLEKYSPFDIKSINNSTLQSFAAFCQKGDSNIDILESYLISNGIEDGTVAFSLWGLVFGFAEMPKTFTNSFFDSDDVNYISEMYKYIFEQVHNIELKGVIERDKSVDNSIHIPSRMNAPGSLKDSQNSQMTNIPDELKKVLLLASNEFNNMPKCAKEFYTKGLVNHFSGKIDDAFINSIEGIEYNKSSKKQWTKIIKKLRDFHMSKNTSKMTDPPSPMFPNDEFFYRDIINAFYLLENYLPSNKKIKKQFSEDLLWFQNNYKEEYFDKQKKTTGIYRNYPKGNREVIENFKLYLKNKRDKDKSKKISDIYQLVPIDKIIAKLIQSYK